MRLSIIVRKIKDQQPEIGSPNWCRRNLGIKMSYQMYVKFFDASIGITSVLIDVLVPQFSRQ